VFFEIYDTETRNLLVDTQTLSEALAIVRATVEKHGPSAIATWLLAEDDEASPMGGRPIATGQALTQLAMQPRVTASPGHD